MGETKTQSHTLWLVLHVIKRIKGITTHILSGFAWLRVFFYKDEFFYPIQKYRDRDFVPPITDGIN